MFLLKNPLLLRFIAIIVHFCLPNPNSAMISVGSVGNKRYYWDDENLNSSWIDSVSTCHKEGLYIASIENEAEQNFLVQTGNQRNWTKYLNIGGTDLFSEENWRWIRSGNPFNYTNWYPGSPYPDPDGRNWNCLGLDPASNWSWVDIGCNEYFVMTLCEFP